MVLTPKIMQTAFTAERQGEDKEPTVEMIDESENISGEQIEESMFRKDTVVSRIESRPFKGIPNEWHETI